MTTNLPIWGTPIPQLPRISLTDAQAGALFLGVGKAGQAGAYIGVVTESVLGELLGASSGGTPAEAISHGAQGIVWNVGVTTAGSLSYTSTQGGPSLPYLSRQDIPVSAQILNTTGILRVVFAYGQSWQTIDPSKSLSLSIAQAGYAAAVAAGNTALATAFNNRIAFSEAAQAMSAVNTVFKFSDSSRNPVAQIGSPTGYNAAADFLGCNAETAGNPFGNMFAICLQAFALRDLSQVQPIMVVCASYPGTGMAALLNPTDPLFVEGNSGQQPWLAQVQMIALVNQFAALYGLTPFYEMVLLVESPGTGAVGTLTPLLNALLADYDALNLNADGATVQLWLSPTPANTSDTTPFPCAEDQVNYPVVNPTRAWNFGPWYDGTLNDYIHWDYITLSQNAERAAYCKHLVDIGVGFNNAPRISDIYLVSNGNGTFSLTLDISEPIPGKYISVVVDPNLAVTGLDSQWGLRYKQANGTFLPITGLSVTGSRITGTVTGACASGDFLDYAWDSEGTQQPGTHSPCWGNLKKPVTQSVILPSLTVDLWVQGETIGLTGANFQAAPPVPAITSVSMSNLTAQANQIAQSVVGVISSTTTGTVGAITYTLTDTGGNFILASDGATVDAIAGLPAGSFPLTVIATSASGASLTQPFTIISS